MKIRSSFLGLFSVGFFSLPAHAGVSFKELNCFGGPGLSTRSFKAKVQGSKLAFHYESSNMQNLLEAIFPPGTPPELSGLYRCMELELSVPVSDCNTSRSKEFIACESDNVKLKITAKNACYKPTKTKIFTGEAISFAFETKKTTEDNTNYLTHDWSFRVKGKNTAVDFTDSYIANFWQGESGTGRPACRVDNYVIDYRN